MVLESKLTSPLFHEDLSVLGNSAPSKDLEVRFSLVDVIFEIRVTFLQANVAGGSSSPVECCSMVTRWEIICSLLSSD